MGKSINRVTLLGNVGRDVEFKSTQGGLVVANASLATSYRVKEGGEWKDATEWHYLVFFDKLAEIVRQYVSKGSKIHVEGKLRTRSWDAKDGSGKRYRTEIIVDDLVLLGGGQERNEYSQEYPPGTGEVNHPEIDDSDIPF